MDLKHFTAPQRQALLDLAMLAMYADGHLAAEEDQRVAGLLTAMGFSTDYERTSEYHASVARVRQHLVSAQETLQHATTLASSFNAPAQKRMVHDFVRELVASDRRVAPQEGALLSALRQAMNL
jgi:hypothetical protein